MWKNQNEVKQIYIFGGAAVFIVLLVCVVAIGMIIESYFKAVREEKEQQKQSREGREKRDKEYRERMAKGSVDIKRQLRIAEAERSENHPRYATLKQIMETVIPLYDGMPCPKLVIADKYSRELRSGVHINGFWDDPCVYILEDYLKKADYYDLVETMKHELIHAWQTYFGFNLHDNIFLRDLLGHDTFFFCKALELGVDIEHTLALYPDSQGAYNRLVQGGFKGMTPKQIWDKTNPGVERKVRNGWD